uniref:carbohydrate porin n=1 Tax=Succinivibrio sp. TaxID=2053619 RepID=UPI00402AAE60
DTYGEIGLGADLAKVDDTVWSVYTMLAVSDREFSNSWQEADRTSEYDGVYRNSGDTMRAQIAFRQYKLNVKGLLDWDKDASIWVGKNYYRREDIHITDWYYYDISGNGAGVEDLSVGSGKLSVAWLAKTDATTYKDVYDGTNTVKLGSTPVAYRQAQKFDVRYNVGLWDGANLQISNLYLVPEEENALVHSNNGNVFGLELTQGFNGGWNKTVFQWGHAAYAGAMMWNGDLSWYDGGDTQDNNGFRFINTGDTTITDSFKIQHVAQYAWGTKKVDGQDDEKVKFAQLVVRPFLQLTKMTRLIWEAGAYVQTQKKGDYMNNVNRGQKLTMAYGITPDASNVWSRPEIRFFVSYIHANNANVNGKIENENVTRKYGEKDCNNVQFGAQVEAWF